MNRRSKEEAEDEILAKAGRILEQRAVYNSDAISLTSPPEVLGLIRTKMALHRNEVFVVMYLDNKHSLIEYKEQFLGTIGGCSVYSRVIVQDALKLNAAAIVLAHNHPSGLVELSEADKSITRTITEATALVDVRVLDHIIVGSNSNAYTSFAEQGLM